jgi:cell division protein FtsQ
LDKSSPILVHFGDSDFANRYRLLAENIDQWRAASGRVDSVDLRFARQVVVNPETRTVAAHTSQSAPQRVRTVRKRP